MLLGSIVVYGSRAAQPDIDAANAIAQKLGVRAVRDSELTTTDKMFKNVISVGGPVANNYSAAIVDIAEPTLAKHENKWCVRSAGTMSHCNECAIGVIGAAKKPSRLTTIFAKDYFIAGICREGTRAATRAFIAGQESGTYREVGDGYSSA